MMMIEDVEDFEESFYEELEMRFLRRHTMDELKIIAIETGDQFCLEAKT